MTAVGTAFDRSGSIAYLAASERSIRVVAMARHATRSSRMGFAHVAGSDGGSVGWLPWRTGTILTAAESTVSGESVR